MVCTGSPLGCDRHWYHMGQVACSECGVERSTGGDPNLDGEAPARLSGCDFSDFTDPVSGRLPFQLRDTVIESDEVLRQSIVIG